KSLGNFFTVRDLLDQGVPGEVIRFVFLSTHYRKPMDWTVEKAAQATTTLRKWRALTEGIEPSASAAPAVADALADDLNSPGAIAELHRLAQEGERAVLLASARLLGLLTPELGGWEAAPGGAETRLRAIGTQLAELREAAMASKDFSEVDRVKAALIAAGVEVRMSKAGVQLVPGAGFDVAKLEAVE
ncbi:MAG: DALR domain-containing protein, partial [Pseudomonadota bacterium]